MQINFLNDFSLYYTIKFLFSPLPVRHIKIQVSIKTVAVIGMYQMCQFMKHHILYALCWLLYQFQIEIDVPSGWVAASPSGFHLTNADAVYLFLHKWLILLYSFMKMVLGFLRVPLL